MRSFITSTQKWEEAKRYLTGGESSQGRTWLYPLYMSKAKGSRITDVDNNEYIDYMLGYGALILGHGNDRVVKAITKQAQEAFVHGYNHVGEIELAKKVTSLFPNIEEVKFNVTGTEAVQAAIRMARTYTGKSKVLKFVGQYHGWNDSVLISGAATKEKDMGPYSSPNAVIISKGQPSHNLEGMMVAHWNDLDQVEGILKKHKGELAAVLTEPMMTNAHIITAKPGYLKGLKELCKQYGVLLIFDEVVTGFRLDLRGGQGYFGVTPDITAFGKAMGGGMALSCIGASREIMSVNRPDGAIHLGTFNSSPIAVAAADACLGELIDNEQTYYPRMRKLGEKLKKGIKETFDRKGIPVLIQGTETLFAVMFTDKPAITNFSETFGLNTDRLHKYKTELYKRGIMGRPELRDIWYLSAAHTEKDIDETLNIIEEVSKLI